LLDGIYDLSVTAVVDGSSPFSARQTVQIVNGAETTVNITLDLSRKKQQEERR
jgi:precorrin-6x reductase